MMLTTAEGKRLQTETIEEDHWQKLLTRDREADGTFVFAVRSTGIYCRPSCPARRPRRENVVFFTLPEEAQEAGFRPCQRCYPDQEQTTAPLAEMIEQICRYIEDHLDAPLHLSDLSQQFHISQYHLQRTFKRIKGISPRQYVESCRLEQFKTRLQQGEAVTSALYSAGYQSSSNVYDRTLRQLGMTPTAYRQGGKGMKISYSLSEGPLGYVLIAATERGVVAVRMGDSAEALADELSREYPAATIEHDDEALRPWMVSLLSQLRGEAASHNVPLDVQATAFQWKVWQALKNIPVGKTRSYQDIAQEIGQPTAVRAVANACASNPVAIFIPCHRVVRNNGQLGGYRWGIQRKQQLLSMEKAVTEAE